MSTNNLLYNDIWADLTGYIKTEYAPKAFNPYVSPLRENKSKEMFLHKDTPCILVYADSYKTSKAVIQKISPNNAKDFWNRSTTFDITLKVTDLKLKPERIYPESLNIEDSFLFVSRENDLIVFRDGHCYTEDMSGFYGYNDRVLKCSYKPCPPEVAKNVGEKAGLFKTKEQTIDEEIAAIEDPAVRRLKKILKTLERKDEV